MKTFLRAAAVFLMSGWVSAQTPTNKNLVYPIIPNVGGVVPLPNASEQPRRGAKVVFDITADAKTTDLNKGLGAGRPLAQPVRFGWP
jgi:hypothetical protein